MELLVADSGPGIAEEDHERIFERFVRLDPSGSKQGSGLGLAICRKLVESHGGRIWVESRVGEGSVFHVTIPVADGARKDSRTSDSRTSDSNDGARKDSRTSDSRTSDSRTSDSRTSDSRTSDSRTSDSRVSDSECEVRVAGGARP